MENHIPQLSFRDKKDNQIEPAKYYIYEVSKYIIYKKENRCELFASKFLMSKKYIELKNSVETSKECTIYITCSLIGAPKEYIENLPIYELKKKTKNEKEQSIIYHRQIRGRKRK